MNEIYENFESYIDSSRFAPDEDYITDILNYINNLSDFDDVDDSIFIDTEDLFFNVRISNEFKTR